MNVSVAWGSGVAFGYRIMNSPQRFTAIIKREDDGFVEALTLLSDMASPSEIVRRARYDVFVTQVEVPVGWTPRPFGP